MSYGFSASVPFIEISAEILTSSTFEAMLITYSAVSISNLFVFTLKYLNVLSSNGISTCLLSPAFKNTFLNPFNSFLGLYILSDLQLTYIWAISSPSIFPVFVIVNVTLSSATFISEYSNVVYESPYPNGYFTGTLAVS